MHFHLFHLLFVLNLFFLVESRHGVKDRGLRLGGHRNKYGHHRHGKGRCTRCPPGWGVKLRCHFQSRVAEEETPVTERRDTLCEPCPSGTYSAHRSYKRGCYLCSRCGVGLYVAHSCTSTKDTVCDSCMTVKGPRNEDFIRRCVNHTYDLPNVFKKAKISVLEPQISSLTSSVNEHVDAPEKHIRLETKDDDKPIFSNSAKIVIGVLTSFLALVVVVMFFIVIAYWKWSRIPKKSCFKCNSRHKYHEIQMRDDLECDDEDVTSC